MKRTLVATSVAVAVFGFLNMEGALAQQGTAPGATTPPPPVTTPDAKASSANQAVLPARTEPAPSAFSKLDMKQRGYLNSEDVSKLEGFDFKKADKNGDGKLDATEFSAAWATYGGK